MKKKTNYQVTIGYKAVICVNVKAESEEEAKLLAIDKFEFNRERMYGKNIDLQDDCYRADGVLNMDATWNMYDK